MLLRGGDEALLAWELCSDDRLNGCLPGAATHGQHGASPLEISPLEIIISTTLSPLEVILSQHTNMAFQKLVYEAWLTMLFLGGLRQPNYHATLPSDPLYSAAAGLAPQ